MPLKVAAPSELITLNKELYNKLRELSPELVVIMQGMTVDIDVRALK